MVRETLHSWWTYEQDCGGSECDDGGNQQQSPEAGSGDNKYWDEKGVGMKLENLSLLAREVSADQLLPTTAHSNLNTERI